MTTAPRRICFPYLPGSISPSSAVRALADCDRWRALSRFHLRRGGQLARPCASASRRGAAGAGDKALAHVEPVQEPGRRAARRRGCASRALPITCSSPIPARRRWNAPSRRRATITRPRATPNATASSPSKARSMAARWRRSPRPARQKYLEGFGPPMEGFDQVPLGDIDAVKKAIGPQTAGILIEPMQGEGGVRAAPPVVLQGAAPALRRAWPAADLRRGADRHGPHRRSVRLSAGRRHARRDVAGQGARRRLSDRRVPRHRGRRRRHDAGLARLDLRRQSAGDGGRQCRARRHAGAGLLRSRQKMSLLLKQKLASVVDRHPDVVAKCAARAC